MQYYLLSCRLLLFTGKEKREDEARSILCFQYFGDCLSKNELYKVVCKINAYLLVDLLLENENILGFNESKAICTQETPVIYW